MKEQELQTVLPGVFADISEIPGEKLPCLPAFDYDGIPFDVKQWKRRKTDSEENKQYYCRVHHFISPDASAKLTVTVKIYKEFPAVELSPELTVCSKHNTGIFSDFMTFSEEFAVKSPETVVRAFVGTQMKPEDFSLRTFTLADREFQRDLKFETPEGRSSAEWMPYLGIDFDTDHGLELAVGWSGWWQVAFQRTASALKISAGLGESHFRMYPGEHFKLPGALLFYRSNIGKQEFQSVIRDFMIRYKVPRDSHGKIFQPLMAVTASGGNRPPESMHKIIRYVSKYKMPFNTFWIDAGGWGPKHLPDITKNCGNCWSIYVGWWVVNRTIHPDGNFRKIADAANAAGMKLLLWFEPERVMDSAPVFKKHPEYVYPAEIRSGKEKQYGHRMLDLGNPEARQWIFDLVCKNIDESHLEVYRQDMNINPGLFWSKVDTPDRIGAAEIRHINGLYIYWDMLRKRYPDMLIENCASGGRRMDYEAMSRCYAYCRSDYFVLRREEWHDKQIMQGQNATLNTLAWIPFQGNEADPAHYFDDYDMFSLAGTGIVFTPFDWENGIFSRNFTRKETQWFKKCFDTIDRMRKILTGHFRPLTPPATLDTSLWTAWQGHDPEKGQGFVIAFRREHAPEETRVFSPCWINPHSKYELEDYSTGKMTVVSGKELASFQVTLSPRSFRLVFYRKKENKK